MSQLIVDNLIVTQFGCGGTGGWLVTPLSKFLNNVRRHGIANNVKYTPIDFDIVERPNIIRQDFTEEDIGSLKCQVSAKKAAKAFKNVDYISEDIVTPTKLTKYFKPYFDDINSQYLHIIIGCIDKVKVRRSLYSFLKTKFKQPVIYIDAGNDLNGGQVITTSFNLDHFDPPIFKNQKTFEGVNIHKVFKKENEVKQDAEPTCAFFGDQSQGANLFGSTICFLNIQNLIVERTLPPSYIDYYNSGWSTFAM